MPVARIYTRYPDESAGLAARLRGHGYIIEIVDPGAFHVTPADLEVQLDRLRTGEAITKAVRFARERDAQVFVGAGFALEDEAQRALQGVGVERGNVFSLLFHGLHGLVRKVRRSGAEAHAVRAARRQQKLDMELAREAERKRRAEAAAAERAERELRAREEEERRQAERAAIATRQREEEQRRSEAAARLAAERETQLAEQRREEEAQRQEHAAAAARLAAEAAERRRVEDEAARLEHERQQQLLARIAEQRRLAEQERITEQPALPAAAPVPSMPRKPRMVPPASLPRQSERINKRAFAAAAAIAILAAAGWGAYENRMPAAPLSNSQLVHGSQIQQDVPFGAATIKPAAQPPANMVRPPAVQAQARTPARPQAAHSKPSPQPAKPAATHPKHKQRFADDTDMIAEDEVVYHGAPKKPAQNSTAKAQSAKKISDLGDQ